MGRGRRYRPVAAERLVARQYLLPGLHEFSAGRKRRWQDRSPLRPARVPCHRRAGSLTGEHVFQRGRVLIVSRADDNAELRRRILAVRLHHNVDREDLKGWLFLVSCPGSKGGKLMAADRTGRIQRGALATYLEDVDRFKSRKIDIVSLDPFVKAHSVEENSNMRHPRRGAGAHRSSLRQAQDRRRYPAPYLQGSGRPRGAQDQRGAGRGASSMKDGGRLADTRCCHATTTDEAQAFNISEHKLRELHPYG